LVWIRHNDGFYSHPKVIQLGAHVLEAVGLDTLTSCWSGQQLTDGHVPDALVIQLARRRVPKVVDALLATGLWDRCSEHSGCYLIHDFLDRNPSKQDVASTRQERAAAGRRGGLARAKAVPKQDPSKSPGVAEALSSPRTRPVPGPVPVPKEKTASAVEKIEAFADEIRALFEIERSSRSGTGLILLTDKRQRHARARLLQPYPLADCEDAIRGCLADVWCRKTANDNMAYALQNGETLEKYRDLWRNREPQRRHTEPLTDSQRGLEPTRIGPGDFAGLRESA